MAFLQDTFTDTDGTLLQNHTPDIGGTWSRTVGSANFTIQGNACQLTGASTAQLYENSATPPSADYSVEAQVQNSNPTNSSTKVAVVGRKQSGANTFYGIALLGGANGVRGVGIEKSIAGTNTTLATWQFDWQANTYYTLKLSMQGSTIKGYVDGVERLSVTDTDITGAGRAGIRARPAATGDVSKWDNLVAGPLAVDKPYSDSVSGTEVFSTPRKTKRISDFGIGVDAFSLIKNKRYSDAGVGAELFEKLATLIKTYSDSATGSEILSIIEKIQTTSFIARYASSAVEISGVKYEERLVDSPSISQSVPEFFSGISLPDRSSISLANTDKAILNLRPLRGKRAIIKRAIKTSSGLEVSTIYRGIANSATFGLVAGIEIRPLDFGILDIPFPAEKITVDKFPDAIDLDFPIPYVIGTAKKVPLSLIKAQSTPTVQFQYLIGRGDLTVDVVYRDELVLKEYTGTAQGGGTNTITLSASDTRNDDFYNDSFILITGGTGNGQVRRITDYVKATKIATVDSDWTIIPDATSTYVIREWKKILLTISGTTYTGIEFAIEQRDRDRLFNRQRVSADVTGLQVERNPARAIKSILELVGGSVDATSFTIAESDINTIGNLFVDGAVAEERRLFDIINELCLIGRIRLEVNPQGQFAATVDKAADTIKGTFATDSNIVDILPRQEQPLDSLIKSFSSKYRRQFNTNEYRLSPQKRIVFAEGKQDVELEFDFIFDKTTADKVCDYLAKRKKSLDMSLTVLLSHEARNLGLGDVIRLKAPQIGIDDSLYQVISTRKSLGKNEFDLIAYDDSVYIYSPGTLPSDPVTDGRADFSKTPPDAVSGLSITWELVQSSYTATAKLTWTNPTENFREVIVEYKKSTDPLYNTFATTNGTAVEIPGLSPGLNYDFRFTSVNKFDLQGGVALLTSQLAPGDSTAPATPTGLTGSGKFGTLTWTWDENTEGDLDYYQYRIWDAPSGGSLIKSGKTKDNKVDFQAQTGALTTSITRYLQVRAVDFSGNASAYTSRVGATSSAIGQGDITTNAVQRIVSASNTGTTTTSPVISLTLPNATNRPIWIEFSALGRGSAGYIISIQVNSNTVYSDVASGAYGPGMLSAKAYVAQPGTGNLSVQVSVGNIPPEGISNRNLIVYEAKNA